MRSHDPGVDLPISACNELIEAACQAASVEEIHALCGHLCERACFDYFFYGAMLPVSLVRPRIFIISGYPGDWWRHYQDNGYMGIDPVVQHGISRHTVPLDWNDIDPAVYANSRQIRGFLQEAADFGLASGVTFPVHGQHGESAILSLASNDDHDKARGRIIECMPVAQLLAGYIHEAARRVFAQREVTLDRPTLTRREQECLLWAAEGKTSWDIAMILNISERTVLFHLQNAGHKLNVNNRAQAVARAVAHGYITPQFS